MDQFYVTRTDGPNATATNKTLSYGEESSMTMHTQDETFNGVPSRVVTDMTLNVPETDLANAPVYAAKGIETELQDLKQSGRQQLVTPVSDPAQSAEFKRIAAKTGSSYMEQDGKGVFTPGAAPVQDSLSDAFKVASSLQNNYSEDEVRKYLADKGYDRAQVDSMFDTSRKIVSARDAGYSDDEVMQFLQSKEVAVKSVETKPVEQPEQQEYIVTYWGAIPKKSAYEQVTSSNSMTAEELLASMKVLAPNMSSMSTRVMGFFGNEDAARKAEAGAVASRNRIIQLASERGLQLSWDDKLGEFVAQTQNGPVVVQEDTWDSILNESGEMIGAVAGGAAGAKLGSRFGPWGALGFSMLGAAAGSIAGTQVDYLRQAIELQADLEGKVMAHKALTAAEMSVIGDVLGFGLYKASGATYKGFKRVKDYIIDGNSEGAYKALKEMEFITDEQAEETVRRLSEVMQGSIPGAKPQEEAIAAIAATKPGVEGLVQAAATVDPKSSRAIGKAIDDRAKDLLAATKELSGENLGRILKEDLGNYVADVKNFYGQVKAQAAQSPRATNFAFDFDKLAIQPVLDTLQKNITDPAVLEKFSLQASRIRSMSDARTFGDLLELRQIVNEFKFNTKITKQKDFETLNKVIGNIDGAIRKGAEVVLENPQAWLKDYDIARIQYAKMKQLERNVMYQALTRDGISEKDVVRSLSKYITSLDGTYNDLVTKLPAKMKARVENATIDVLANKYTAGVGDSQRAVNFPMLADELNMVTFTTPDARKMKVAINKLAEVFKNDVPLSRVTGSIQIPKFQSYLTTDPVMRAKYEIASRSFNAFKRLIPGKETATLALVNKAAALLENPLSSKSVKELMDAAAGEVDLSASVLKLQQEAARAKAVGKDTTAPRVKLYGSGKVLSAKGSGQEVLVPAHRIATTEEALQIADSQGINPADTKLLDQILAQYGYKAVQQGTDKVRLL